MLIESTSDQRQAILASMRQVATSQGMLPLTKVDHITLEAANRYVFRATDALDIEGLPQISPQELEVVLSDKELAEYTIRFLTVMAFVDGVVDENKIATVLDYATAVDIHEDYLKELKETAQHHFAGAMADMSRRNYESITGEPWTGGDLMNWFLPYKDSDLALITRYQALSNLSEGTLGRTFWEFYRKKGFAFPGEESALNERFATPHDSTHILSGYDTSPRGEILVSTFTAGMHPQEPMAGHILPVIFSWHLGIKINDVAGAVAGALDPEKFWEAWTRGSEVKVDLFDKDWSFWTVTGETIDQLRERYNILPPGAALTEIGDRPSL